MSTPAQERVPTTPVGTAAAAVSLRDFAPVLTPTREAALVVDSTQPRKPKPKVGRAEKGSSGNRSSSSSSSSSHSSGGTSASVSHEGHIPTITPPRHGYRPELPTATEEIPITPAFVWAGRGDLDTATEREGLALIPDPQVSHSHLTSIHEEREREEREDGEVAISGIPFPYMAVGVIAFVLYCNAISMTVIFPFLPFMVQSFGVADTEKEIGYYAGFIASALFLGRLPSSYLFGRLADRIGRKPVLLFSLVDLVITNLWFGLSKTLWMAVLARFCSGLFNAIIGVGKATLNDVCSNQTHKAKAMTVIGAVWGLGLISGSVMGGLLAQPATKLDGLKGSFLDTFPFFLPMAVATIIPVVAIPLLMIYLKEDSKKGSRRNRPNKMYTPLSRVASTPGNTLDPEDEHSIHSDDDDDDDDDDADDDDTVLRSNHRASRKGKGRVKIVGQGQGSTSMTPTLTHSNTNNNSSSSSSSSGGSSSSSIGGGGGGTSTVATTRVGRNDDDVDVELGVIHNDDDDADGEGEGERERGDSEEQLSLSAMLKRPEVFTAIGLYTLLSFIMIVFDEVFTLWIILDTQDGGLGFRTNEIGIALGLGGVVVFAMQLYVYPKVARRYSETKLFLNSCFIMACFIPLFPLCNLLTPLGDGVVWIVLMLLVTVRHGATLFALTTVFLLINSSVPGHAVGAVNGLATTTVALVRCIGPVVGSPLFAWSLHNGQGFPLNFFLVFILEGIICWALFALAYARHRQLQKEKEHPLQPL